MKPLGKDFNPEKFFKEHRDFKPEGLSPELKETISEMCRQARGSVIKMTTIANSGHPGGSMSSMEFYMLLYSFANLRPSEPWWSDRDRIVISHGHTSPGAYTALGYNGFFDVTKAHHGFRQAGSPFEGHVERSVPGIEWDTGNLGQGLSAGLGKAVAGRVLGKKFHVYVTMGDGEQQKGQITEARRFAVKFGFNNVTAIVDYNQRQISGDINIVMPQKVAENWRSDGWNVVEVDGHNLDELYSALRAARYSSQGLPPTVIIAHTVMGKGYPPIENDHNYHGAAMKPDMARDAFRVLGLTDSGYDDLDQLKEKRKAGPPGSLGEFPKLNPRVMQGTPRTYPVDKPLDNRSGWGNALVDIAGANNVGKSGGVPMAVFDCDLAGSVKTADFESKYPDSFFQSGISEHSTGATAGACSSEGVLTFWSDFGVFGICETYNQNRLNDINHTNLKVMCTHCGLDVGEDGKTHQCIDYFSLSRSVFGWKLFTPADPNQTDRIARYVAKEHGNFLVVMGRSKFNPIDAEDGSPYFGGDYEFRPGRVDMLRDGSDLTIFCAGNVAKEGIAAWKELNKEGVSARLISTAHWADFHIDDLVLIAETGRIVTVEDHNVNCGIGKSLASELFANKIQAQMDMIGVSEYGPSGESSDVYKMMNIDSSAIVRVVHSVLSGSRKKAPESVSVG